MKDVKTRRRIDRTHAREQNCSGQRETWCRKLDRIPTRRTPVLWPRLTEQGGAKRNAREYSISRTGRSINPPALEKSGTGSTQRKRRTIHRALLSLHSPGHGTVKRGTRTGRVPVSRAHRNLGRKRKREAKNVPGQLGLPLAVVFQTTKVRVNGRPSSLFFPRIGPGRHGWVGCRLGS
jgi:hypothetical protein